MNNKFIEYYKEFEKTFSKEDIKSRVYDKQRFYESLLEALLDFRKKDDICYVSQKDLAKKINCNSSLISKSINNLIKIDAVIEKIGPGKYRVDKTDMIKYGPINRYLRLLMMLVEDISIVKLNRKEQEKLLNMSKYELEVAYGYLFLEITIDNGKGRKYFRENYTLN